MWRHLAAKMHSKVGKMADTAGDGGGSQANNPLSRKLNKILEGRLDNDKVCF